VVRVAGTRQLAPGSSTTHARYDNTVAPWVTPGDHVTVTPEPLLSAVAVVITLGSGAPMGVAVRGSDGDEFPAAEVAVMTTA
jgi:hypothetical protein